MRASEMRSMSHTRRSRRSYSARTFGSVMSLPYFARPEAM
jgi:hypothetical protein